MEGAPPPASAPESPAGSAAAPPTSAAEPRGERFRRRSRRARLYTTAFGLVALLVALVALVLANTRTVELSWVFGSTTASLVWIIVASAVLGWLTGLVTSALLRRRTRRSLET